jgi:hypothetical protein
MKILFFSCFSSFLFLQRWILWLLGPVQQVRFSLAGLRRLAVRSLFLKPENDLRSGRVCPLVHTRGKWSVVLTFRLKGTFEALAIQVSIGAGKQNRSQV